MSNQHSHPTRPTQIFLKIGTVVEFCEKIFFVKFLIFLVDRFLRYGSANFDRNAMTRTGQAVIAQLLWELQHSVWYQMKGI